MKVKDCYQSITRKADTVLANAPISEVVRAIRRDMMSRTVFVLDDKMLLAGAIPAGTLLRILGAKHFRKDSLGMMHEVMGTTAGDIMVECPSIRPDDGLEEALKKMVQSDQEDLPVVDSDGHVIGELNCFELISAYASEK